MITIIAVDAKVSTLEFEASVSGRDECDRAALDALRIDFLAAFLKCRSEEAKARATEKLFAEPVDVTTAEGLARFESLPKGRKDGPPWYDIEPVCGSSAGFRNIYPNYQGVKEYIALSRLS